MVSSSKLGLRETGKGKGKGNGKCNGKGNGNGFDAKGAKGATFRHVGRISVGRSRFPGGMTERKARAKAKGKGNGKG